MMRHGLLIFASSIQDYCITLTTPNSTQINTSRQCMLKSIHVTTNWHLSHRFMVHTKSFIFVSNVVTLCVRWLISTSKVIMFCIWLPKLNLCQHVFTLYFFICACEYILFLQSTYVDQYYFSYADIANSFRVSLVVMIYSIWAHGGGESFFVILCVFLINLGFRFRLQDQVQSSVHNWQSNQLYTASPITLFLQADASANSRKRSG